MLKLIRLFVLPVFIFFLPVSASEVSAPAPLSFSFHQFSQAEQFNGKWITIRGFLYLSPTRGWILSSEPNMKSCCVDTDGKRVKQIIVEGDFSTSSGSKALLLTGQLITEQDHYILRNARLFTW